MLTRNLVRVAQVLCVCYTYAYMYGVAVAAASQASQSTGTTSSRSRSRNNRSIPQQLNEQQQQQQQESKGQPNFVLILTDDLDLTLGGLDASTLSNTRRALIGDHHDHHHDQGRGVVSSNWFVHTPVCCPSRAQLLTGKMFHNLRTRHFSSNAGCMHVDVNATNSSNFYKKDYFAQYFQQLNYTVGIFGKHLNYHNPTDFLPKGVDQWLINGGGDYLNPSFTWASKGSHQPEKVVFDNCTESTGMPCYSTSVIGNASLAWIQRHLDNNKSNKHRDDDHDHTTTVQPKPFFGIISVKAPHIQDGPGFPMSIPAPWYENTSIPEDKAPRTLNYNKSCPDHHWLVRNQPPLSQLQGEMVDELYNARLKTLLSVDDLVVDLIALLERNKVLDNTFVVFTSDNGYRLGQLRMPVGKFHAYENDIRVPMMLRGPGLDPSAAAGKIVGSHVDLMPTLLGFAQQDASQAVVPSTMDGTNLAGGFLKLSQNDHYNNDNDAQSLSAAAAASHLHQRAMIVEYMSLGDVHRYQHLEDTLNHTFLALRIFNLPNTNETCNLKYVEYRDSREDWDCLNEPLEMELFDLDKDPFEVNNLVGRASPLMLQVLRKKLSRLFHCQGATCRQEQLEGWFLEGEDAHLPVLDQSSSIT